MFNLFGSGKNYSIGIDFGTSAIKIIELSFRNQKTYLENYGRVDLGLANPSSVVMPNISNTQAVYNKKLQKYLEKLIKSMKLKSKGAYISLPGFSGLITVIDFPEMNEEELEEAIKFEARKYIPVSLDDIALDWEIIKNNAEVAEKNKDENAKKKEGIQLKVDELNSSISKNLENDISPEATKKNEILLVAAPKNEVIRCGNIVKESGLSVKNVELELFSLVRALIGNDSGCFLVIDIGAKMTNLILVEGGMIRVSRNIEGGGNEVTNVIADSLNISKQRAEEMKKENKDLLNSREIPISIPVLDMIANESVRIINAYKEKRGASSRVDGIILSGGSSKLKGIDKYFYQKIGVQTILGNPWRRVICGDKLDPFIESMGTSFSVALGLAFRGIEELNKRN